MSNDYLANKSSVTLSNVSPPSLILFEEMSKSKLKKIQKKYEVFNKIKVIFKNDKHTSFKIILLCSSIATSLFPYLSLSYTSENTIIDCTI